jgi:hypothetical protein
MFATATLEIPSSAASSREDQCVTPSFVGGPSIVRTTTSSGSTTRGRPERLRSPRPSSPAATYRARQVTTVCRVTPSRAAIAVFDSPPAAASTIRARSAKPAGNDGERVHERNTSRSASGSNNGAADGTRHPSDHL